MPIQAAKWNANSMTVSEADWRTTEKCLSLGREGYDQLAPQNEYTFRYESALTRGNLRSLLQPSCAPVCKSGILGFVDITVNKLRSPPASCTSCPALSELL